MVALFLTVMKSRNGLGVEISHDLIEEQKACAGTTRVNLSEAGGDTPNASRASYDCLDVLGLFN